MRNERANILELLERTVANNMNEIRANFRFSVVIFTIHIQYPLRMGSLHFYTEPPRHIYYTGIITSDDGAFPIYTQHNTKIRRGMPVSTTKRVIVI